MKKKSNLIYAIRRVICMVLIGTYLFYVQDIFLYIHESFTVIESRIMMILHSLITGFLVYILSIFMLGFYIEYKNKRRNKRKT